ncbi:MAG: thioredoxin domain-containing protein [Acidobacteriia bacterium]|nr:thioredoxin domain-containing protein [Terriglobia bacterium]
MRKTLLLALSLIGLFDALYLWWTYAGPTHPMVCVGSGCDTVRASPFAYPLGIPMPLFGAAMYAVLALLVFAWQMLPEPVARLATLAVAGISGLGFLFSLYLSGLEAFVLHAWCFWCVISAITVTLIFAVAILDMARPLPHPEPAAARGLTRRHAVTLAIWVLIGAPAFLLLARSGTLPPPQQVNAEALAKHLVRPDSHMTGSPTAALTVVEFGDIQCPACSVAEATAREIRVRYGNRIRFVFRQFPLQRIHPYAEKAAEASECAGTQGKFWDALDKLYQGQADLSDTALLRYAGELGLNVGQFRACLSSGAMASRVHQDLNDGLALGVAATPTFFVGSVMITGPMRYSEFAQLIDRELARAAIAASPSGQQATASAGVPAAPDTSASTGLTTNSGIGSFGQFQASAGGCSEAEAQKQTPDLIHTPEARQAFEAAPKALFVDVRESSDFKRERIPSAINIPLNEIEQRWGALPKTRDIILYESGRTPGDVCAAGRAAGRILLANGFSPDKVKIYEDGLAGWEKAGLPVVR